MRQTLAIVLMGVMLIVAGGTARAADQAGAPDGTGVGESGLIVLPPPEGAPLPHFSGTSGDFSLFSKPSIGALHVDEQGRPDSGFYLGTLSNRRLSPVLPDRARPGERAETDVWDVGAVVGYQMRGLDTLHSAAGINLQMVTEAADPQSGLLLQPGVDYTMPFNQSLQLNARFFSTYAAQDGGEGGSSGTGSGTTRLDGDGGWREVGINLGLGYSVNESWTIETQAGVTRAVGDGSRRSGNGDENASTDFFGGVFLNYQF